MAGTLHGKEERERTDQLAINAGTGERMNNGWAYSSGMAMRPCLVRSSSLPVNVMGESELQGTGLAMREKFVLTLLRESANYQQKGTAQCLTINT